MRKRKLTEAPVWNSCEGYSYILRGWILQLRDKMDIDVEAGLLQMWSLYLR